MKNHVKTLRETEGLSQAKLGEMVKVSRQTINSLENGRYNPSIDLAFKLARIFKTSIEELFIYEDEEWWYG